VTLEWLLARADRTAGPDACWPWTGAKDRPGGYARVGVRRVSRLICEAVYGPPPPRAVAMHGCDNPPCVNPLHLRWGTQSENIAEAYAKGRKHGGYTAGMRKRCHRCGGRGHYQKTCSAEVRS